jgi:hypothetical protein
MSSVVLKHEKAESVSLIKSSPSGQKVNSSAQADSFRGLIKEKSKQQLSTNIVTNAVKPKEASQAQKIMSMESEEVGLVEESSVTLEIVETENIQQLGEEHFIKAQSIELDELEEISFFEEDESLEATDLLEEEKNVVPFVISNQPMPFSVDTSVELELGSGVATPTPTPPATATATPTALLKDDLIESHVKERIIAPEVPVANIVTTELDEEFTVQFSKLSPEEQALLQNMKTLQLPKGFKPENRVMEFNAPQAPSKLPEEIKLEMKLHSEANANAEDVEVILKQVLVSNNIMLADATRQGQSVLSKMHLSNVKQEAESVQAFANDSELVIENEEMSADLSGNNSFNSKNSNPTFATTGGVVENRSEDFFQISFKDNLMTGQKGDAMPKPVTQVSLSVIEALNSSSTNGKKTIVINLFPQALGPVRVEVLSVAGKDGVRQIESIKFIADKRETLGILEAAKEKFVELTTKATNIKEETSLEFEMNQGERGQKTEYFANAEEGNLWMNQFTNLSKDGEGMQAVLENDLEEIGYITENSVNIKV